MDDNSRRSSFLKFYRSRAGERDKQGLVLEQLGVSQQIVLWQGLPTEMPLSTTTIIMPHMETKTSNNNCCKQLL